MSKENEIIEGNKLIAEFMEWQHPTEQFSKLVYPYNETHFKYRSSWDWQIPVWSKLSHEVKHFIIGKDEHIIKNYFRWVNLYEEAIFCDDKQKGYSIIIEMLEWYNKEQKTQANLAYQNKKD